MNIQKNILLFDSDILDTDEDIHPIELLFVRDMVTFVQDSNSFKEQIANKSWDIIFINFQTRLFLKIEDAQLDEFVQIVIASQPGSCCNVAITNDRDQISMLKEKGFSIFSKKYNIARIREEFKIFQKVLTTSDIQEYVADYHHMSATKLLEKTRNRNIVEPRQIAMYLSHHLVTKNLKKIGRAHV